MNEEAFNLSIRKFLKMVGINSQREIERAVVQAVSDGVIQGTETFPAHVTLEVAVASHQIAGTGPEGYDCSVRRYGL